MTAEQLEELLGKVAEGGADGFYAKHEIRVLRAALTTNTAQEEG